MSSENIPTTDQALSGIRNNAAAATAAVARAVPEPVMKCPRCDSPNTKFCYYNNYSLTQPRHFCKSCRRYWTKGGALRNVPIGGGCRKNRKMKSCSRTDSRDSASSSSDIGGLKFFHGFNAAGIPPPQPLLPPPAMDFHVGGISFHNMNFPSSSSSSSLNVIPSVPNFNFDPASVVRGGAMNMGMNFPNDFGSNMNIPSSIESLSSMNQDLHWKLQQERLAMMFGNHREVSAQRPQPIMFQNLDRKTEDGGNTSSAVATEWFFDNSYAPPAVNNPTPTNSGSNGNENGAGNWNGIQGWNDINHYSGLP